MVPTDSLKNEYDHTEISHISKFFYGMGDLKLKSCKIKDKS